MLQILNKFNFTYYSCKRIIAKPYPDGPVDKRDSFCVQLCDDFILDIANIQRRLNARPFSFCEVKLKVSVVFQWKKYIKHMPYFALKYESYIGCTVPLLLRQKHKRYFNICSHDVSVL